MLSRVRANLTYANAMATIAVFIAVGTGGAYAADTIGSDDVINESLLSEDVKNGEVKNWDLAPDSVGTGRVIDESLIGDDVADAGLTGDDVAFNSLTGQDVDEESLSVTSMGCDRGLVNGYARIRGSSSMPASYTSAGGWIDGYRNCAGLSVSVQVRRSAVGVYFVRFLDNSARFATASPNSDSAGLNTAVRDNILSVARVEDSSCLECAVFRVQVEDVGGTGSGTVPADGWFTIIAV